jgi:coronin-1B/1C/6
MCFVPRRAVSTPECEIARAYKLTTNAIEPIAFIVPRKVSPPSLPRGTQPTELTNARAARQSDSFQSDIFPPAPSIEPSLTAGEFFTGKAVALKYVSLDTGVVSTAAPTSTSFPPPTRTQTAHAPQPASAPSLSPVMAPPLTKVASEPPPASAASAYAPSTTPASPASVQLPPSRSTSTYTSGVRF